MIEEDRYDKNYQYGKITFFLADFIPDEEQCRLLMLKVLEQAVRDYCTLIDSEIVNDKESWENARAFIFDDDYYFRWGDWELNLESFLDILNLEIDWVREQTKRKIRK